MKIIIGTKNLGKLREFAKEFGTLGVEVIGLTEYFAGDNITEPVEDGITFYDNALIKAKYYYELTGIPCICDDSGLCVDILGGAPGVFSARYSGGTDQDNNDLLRKNLRGHFPATAHYACSLVYYDGKNIVSSEGILEGYIIDDERGTEGFGYDPMFYYPELDKTIAEISMDIKNTISHRGKAIKDMVKNLKKQNLI